MYTNTLDDMPIEYGINANAHISGIRNYDYNELRDQIKINSNANLPEGRAIRITPPLTISDDEIIEGCKIILNTIDNVTS